MIYYDYTLISCKVNTIDPICDDNVAFKINQAKTRNCNKKYVVILRLKNILIFFDKNGNS